MLLFGVKVWLLPFLFSFLKTRIKKNLLKDLWTLFGFCCPVSELYAFISALLSHHWSHLSHGIVGVVCTREFPLKVKHQKGIKYGDGFGRKKRREIIAWLVELGHCFRKLGWAQLQLKRSVAGRETSEMTKCSVFTLDGAMWQHLSMRMNFSKKTSFPPCLDSSHSSHVNPSLFICLIIPAWRLSLVFI